MRNLFAVVVFAVSLVFAAYLVDPAFFESRLPALSPGAHPSAPAVSSGLPGAPLVQLSTQDNKDINASKPGGQAESKPAADPGLRKATQPLRDDKVVRAAAGGLIWYTPRVALVDKYPALPGPGEPRVTITLTPAGERAGGRTGRGVPGETVQYNDTP